MPSLDSLPGDQRAVLQLVLSRGRSYEEIARLLSINPSAVRERALAALNTLGPQTNVSPENRARISDYLLGQLPGEDAAPVRELLADSPSERAWARVLASELAPLSSEPLPEIPAQGSAPTPAEPAAEPVAAPPPALAPSPAPSGPVGPDPAQEPPPGKARRGRRRREPSDPAASPAGGSPRSSRLGGMIVIVAGVIVVAAVLVLLLSGGGGSKHTASSTSTTAASASSTTSSSSSTTTSTSTSAAKVLAQINLTPPSSSTTSKAAGIAEILSEGSTDGIAIVAQNIPANTTKPANAYAVWLYNSPKDAKILGFVNPGVTATGRLSTAGALPANASHFKSLIVTLETTAQPKTPGTIVLQGTLSGVS